MAINPKTGKRLDPRVGARTLPPYTNADEDKAPAPTPDEREALHAVLRAVLDAETGKILAKAEFMPWDAPGAGTVDLSGVVINKAKRRGDHTWNPPEMKEPPVLPGLEPFRFPGS